MAALKCGDKVEVNTGSGPEFGTVVKHYPFSKAVEVKLDNGVKRCYTDSNVSFVSSAEIEVKKMEDVKIPVQQEVSDDQIKKAKVTRLTLQSIDKMKMDAEIAMLQSKLELIAEEAKKVQKQISDIKNIEVKVASKVRHLLSLRTNLCEEAIVAQVKTNVVPLKFKRSLESK